jgi:hypothetical protein
LRFWPGRRTARLALVATAGAAVVLGASMAPAALDVSTRLSPTQLTSTPSASSRTPVARAGLVCAGPEQQGLADQTVPEVAQDVTVEAATAPERALPSSSEGEEGEVVLRRLSGKVLGELDERDAVGRARLEEADGVVIDAREGLAPGLSGVQMYRGDQEQRLALSLTPCREPLDESWLVAGGDAAGRAERIVLVNPSTRAVDVRVEVLGASGAVVAAEDADESGTEVALGAGEREVLLVDALAPGVVSPVVHVSSAPGPVSAFLGDRWLEGSTDAGMQLTAPVAEPARRQVVGGLGDGAGDAGTATVRVAVPGAQGAVVQLRALTARGPQPLDTEVAVIDGHTTRDIAVDELPDDSYALEVSSDKPVVTAVQLRSEAGPQGARDLTWAPALPALGDLGGAPLPQRRGQGRVEYDLALSAPQGGAARVVVADADGGLESTDVDVDAGHSRLVDMTDPAAVWVVPRSGQVFAAVVAHSRVRPRPADDEVAPPDGKRAREGRARPVTLVSVFGVPDLAVTRAVVGVAPELP